MTKTELSEILHKSCDTVSDSVTDMEHVNVYPRIVYWSYLWQDVVASGGNYVDHKTYQVSIWGKTPPERNNALMTCRELLREAGIYPEIRHEYAMDDGAWHSYFAVEVIDD